MSGTKWIVAGLVVLNGILGLAVWQHLGGERTALAQSAIRHDVLTVAGLTNGNANFYMFDTNGGVLLVVRPDANGKKLNPVAQRNVGDDFLRLKAP